MPKVSVIMGIYNCEKTLPLAVESIINQTYTDWELIMCDDGSKDQTYELALKYASQYPNIIVLKNEVNLGLPSTLNNCLKNVRGEYVARMDADDACLPNRFEKQVEFLNKHSEYHVVGSSVLLFDGVNDLNERHLIEIPQKLDLVKGVPHAHPTIMMRKSIYDELAGYQILKRTHRCEDLDLWFRFYSKGFKGYNIQTPLLKYRESMEDYKKRNVKSSLSIVKTTFHGFKMLDISKIYYLFILKPLVAALIPNRIMYKYHKRNTKK